MYEYLGSDQLQELVASGGHSMLLFSLLEFHAEDGVDSKVALSRSVRSGIFMFL